MRNRRFTMGAIAGAGALLLALGGCSDDEPEAGGGGGGQSTQEDDGTRVGGDAPAEGEEPAEGEGPAAGGEEEGEAPSDEAPAIQISIDGEPSTAEWEEPFCLDYNGSMMIDSTSPDGGKLTASIPVDNPAAIPVVNLTVPGEDVEITNYEDAEGNFEDGHLTFDGELADDPYDATSTHQVVIDLTCEV